MSKFLGALQNLYRLNSSVNFKNSLGNDLIRSASTLVVTTSRAIAEMSSKKGGIIYLPDLLHKSVEDLNREIIEHKPTVIVVGANKISAETLTLWRSLFDKKNADGKYLESLTMLRRGTSIAAIDMPHAAKLGITVANTPNVNATEVAKSTYALLRSSETSTTPSRIGLIGFGHIGMRIAKQALADGNQVIAHSPMLYAAYQSGNDKFRGFDITKIDVEGSIEEVIRKSDKLVVLVTIGQYGNGKNVTADALTELNPNAKVICISEPEVFSSKALQELARATQTKNIKIIFDNSPYMMKELKNKLEEFGANLENITFQSKVMSSPECQRDMDIAAVALLLKNALSKKLPDIYRDLKDCQFQIDENQGKRKVRIVGAGISSRIASLYFHENGYEVEIFEKDSKEEQSGTTMRGPDVRQLSYSETVTHATTKRIEDWLFAKITDRNFFEQLFAEQFAVIGDNPPLVSLLQSVVADINKTAIKGEMGWKYLIEKYPDIFSGNVFGSGKMLRLFNTKEELKNGFKFQKSIHDEDEVRMIESEELAERFPQIKKLLEEGKIAGAVEVVGYGVRVISLCDAIEKFLYEKSGTKIKWQHEVQKEGNKFFVKDSNGEKHELSSETPLVISSGVSPIIEADNDINRVYGLFISIPNCGLTDVLKIHEKDPIGVMNITPSKDGKTLHISAGFQYFGQREAREEDLKTLFSTVENKVAELFPESYQKAIAENSLERRFCPRPMTSHGLPKFTKFEGGVSIGGTNSGGTVQAPILGQLARLEIQYAGGLFEKNSELNESVGCLLEGASNYLSFISNWTAAKSPAPVITEVKAVRSANNNSTISKSF